MPSPVIFVHGIGDSSVAWKNTGPAVSAYYSKYYKTADHPYFVAGSGIGDGRFDRNFDDNIRNSCVYVTFLDHFASPEALVGQLEDVIEDTRSEVWSAFRSSFGSKSEIKVNLVCHSMGGLVARAYLARHEQEHHIEKLVMIATPNLGSPGLLANWVPAGLMFGGIGLTIVTANPVPLGLTIIGLGWDIVSQARGVKLLSPAVEAMKPDSGFLRDLSQTPMPTDLEYVSIISTTEAFPHVVANRTLGYDAGDGAISVDSQKLSGESVPNFKDLNYREYYIEAPHYEEPDKAKDKIIEALGLTSRARN